jgi:hypothetical protein
MDIKGVSSNVINLGKLQCLHRITQHPRETAESCLNVFLHHHVIQHPRYAQQWTARPINHLLLRIFTQKRRRWCTHNCPARWLWCRSPTMERRRTAVVATTDNILRAFSGPRTKTRNSRICSKWFFVLITRVSRVKLSRPATYDDHDLKRLLALHTVLT